MKRARSAVLCAALSLLGTAAGVAHAEESAPALRETAAGAQDWSGLGSRFYDVRREAERQLRLLSPSEFGTQARTLLAAEDPVVRRTVADALAARFEDREPDEDLAVLVAEAFLREKDPSVRDRLVQAAARSGSCVQRLRTAVGEEKLDAPAFEQVAAARLLLRMEEVMHLGGIPGFFDGQFQLLYEVDPSVYDRLTLLAWDPRAHGVLRCIAVMAMHEVRRPDLAARLKAIYEAGDTRDPMELYEAFRGRGPQVDALLRKRGLVA